MKKVLVICGMCMLLLLCSTTVWGAKIGESYFADDFENQTGWESLALSYPYWGSSNGGGVSVSEDGKPGNGKCAVVRKHTGSSLQAKPNQALTGTVGISFDMMMNGRSIDGIYLLNSDGTMNGNEWLLRVEGESGSGTYGLFAYKVGSWNSSKIFTLHQNQWINVKMIFDVDNQKYSVWITDANNMTRNVIFNTPVSLENGLNGIAFFYPDYNGASVAEDQIGDFKLDNFDMYKEIPEEYENFENFEIANRIGNVAGWSSSNDGGAVSIVSEENNKYVQINSLWENNVSKIFPAESNDNTVIELKLKAEQPKGQILRVLTDKIENGYKSENVLCFTQDEAGKNQVIYCYGENVWNVSPVTYDSNSWMKLTIVLNRTEKTWYGYLNTNPMDSGTEQLIFQDNIEGLGKLNGLQIHYPVHYVDENSVGKNFCIDDFRSTAFSGEPAYNIAAAVTTADGTPVNTKEELLSAKGTSPVTNVKVTREYYGEMMPAYVVCALYQDGQLLSVNLNKEFAMSGMEKAKTIPGALDFSEINGEGGIIEVKAFLWQGNNLIPLTSAGNKVFE